MQETDKKEFLSIIYPLSAIYELEFSNKHIVKIWFESLSDYSVEEVASAVTRYIKNPDVGSYKPKPADLIKMIEGTSSDVAYSAWTKAIDAVGSVGTYMTVAFDDPIIHRVIDDMGGWCRLGETSEKELPFVKNEFLARYRGFHTRREIPSHGRKLIGRSEAENNKEGFDNEQEVVFIGDQKQAMLVYDGKMKTKNSKLIGAGKKAIENN